MKKPILIIGGGIIGISAAYYLAREGIAVTVIEKGEVGSGSSYGNAGMLCPCHSTPIAAPGVLTQGLKWLLDGESPFYIKPRLNRDLINWLWQFRSYCNQAAFDTAVPLLRDMQYDPVNMGGGLNSHIQLLDAVEARDVELTQQLMAQHFENGRKRLEAVSKGFSLSRVPS